VGSFGEQLRQAREAQHITLQEIAATTKISCRALQALEDEHFDQLPGGIFNKGFVRAYARYVGLDEEKTLASYLAAAKVEASETDMQALSSQIETARVGAREPVVNGTTLVGVLALIVALGLGAVWLIEHRRETREQQAEAASQTAGQAARASAPVAAAPPPMVAPGEPGATMGAGANAASGVETAAPNAGAAAASDATQNATRNATSTATSNASQSASPNGAASGSANPAAKAAVGAGEQPVAAASKAGAAQTGSNEQAAPVEISISATQRAWISVLSDGKKVESLTLDPDKPELRSRSYKAKEKLILAVGNLGGLTVTYNGKPAGRLGTAGQTATITFTPQGMEKQ
jgi:cytoskeleton protein RodZ